METCRYSGKNSYETEDAANRAASWSNSLKDSKSFDVKGLRAYKCNWCYKWHLTSKETKKK